MFFYTRREGRQTKKIEFPELAATMAKNGDTQKSVGELLNKDATIISRKLAGKRKWTIDEAKILCEHYNEDFTHLFKRKEE